MKNTLNLITILAAVSQQVVVSATDGDGLNLKDAPEFLDEAILATTNIPKFTEIPGEIANATPEQLEELFMELRDVITDLTPDQFDGYVEAALMSANGFILAHKTYKAVKGL